MNIVGGAMQEDVEDGGQFFLGAKRVGTRGAVFHGKPFVPFKFLFQLFKP